METCVFGKYWWWDQVALNRQKIEVFMMSMGFSDLHESSYLM